MRAPRPAERMAVAATFEVLSEEKLMTSCWQFFGAQPR